MGDADSCVVFLEKLVKRLVHKSFRLGVQSTRGFVEDKDVGLLDECSCDGNTLLLASGELSSSCASVCFKAIGLYLLAGLS